MPGQAIGWAMVTGSGSSSLGVGPKTKSWMFRFTSPVTRKPREIGLGPVSAVVKKRVDFDL
ncbi:hypothetical protein ACVILL_001182 [Bradyrhizobium sp. USDA 3364]